jgi:uncharacterized protein DUF4258
LAEIGERLVYRVHAIERMVERGISDDDVRGVFAEGKEIENYPDDFPYPRPAYPRMACKSADSRAGRSQRSRQ